MPRILLIEDDVDVRLIIEHVLIDSGYEIDTTGTLGRRNCSDADPMVSSPPDDLELLEQILAGRSRGQGDGAACPALTGSPLAARGVPAEGPLTDPTAGAQP